MASSGQTSWSISAAIADSWALTKRHKKLWLLGLAMVVLTAGGGNGRTSNHTNQQADPDTLTALSDGFALALQRVGLTPGDLYAFEARFSEYVLPGLVDVSPGAYISVFVSGLFILLFGVGLTIAGTQWARASIHIGIRTAAATDKMTIEDVSTRAMSRIWDYFLLGLIPILKLFAICFVGMIAIFILMAITSFEWLTILFLPLLIYFVVMMVRYAIAIIWGAWYLTDEHNPGHTRAFEAGMNLGRGRFWKMVFHGLSVGFVQMIIMMVLVSPIMGVIGYMLFQGVVNNDVFVMFAYAWPLIAVAIVTSQIAMAVNAVLQVFTTGTWYFAFEAIARGGDHDK